MPARIARAFNELIKWRWTPFFALAAGALLVNLFLVLVIPERIDALKDGAQSSSESSPPYEGATSPLGNALGTPRRSTRPSPIRTTGSPLPVGGPLGSPVFQSPVPATHTPEIPAPPPPAPPPQPEQPPAAQPPPAPPPDPALQQRIMAAPLRTLAPAEVATPQPAESAAPPPAEPPPAQ
jgi:hypothetical protein